MTLKYPTAPNGAMAAPMVLVDPATGLPYAAGATVGGATEATLQAVEALLATPAAALPPVPLSDGSDLTRVTIDFTANTDQAVIAGVAAKIVSVYRVRLSVNKPVTIAVWDGPSASGTLKETIQINGTNGGIIVLDFSPRDPYYRLTAGNGLVLKCSDATARVTGRMSFTQG